MLFSVLKLWLALASLCVLDQDHVDRLSSGRWMGKDGQQKQMVFTSCYYYPPKLLLDFTWTSFLALSFNFKFLFCLTAYV